MRRLPPLSSIRAFEAAARHQNFTAAAAELGMTQAAISYQIRLLEERLGLSLFARSRGRVLLTDAGRRAAPLVSAGFDNFAEAFERITLDDLAILSVSTTQTFAANWLAPRLGSFQVQHPDLAVRLHTDNSLVDFARDEIDVAIRSVSGSPQAPGLKADFLFRLHATPLCTPEFAAEHRLREPRDLIGLPRLTPADHWWERWFEQAGVESPGAGQAGGIRFDTQALEGHAVMAGAGPAMMTPMFWRREISAGRLVQPFDLLMMDGSAFWIVYPEHKRAQPKLVAFRRWLLRCMAEAARAEPPVLFIPPEDV